MRSRRRRCANGKASDTRPAAMAKSISVDAQSLSVAAGRVRATAEPVDGARGRGGRGGVGGAEDRVAGGRAVDDGIARELGPLGQGEEELRPPRGELRCNEVEHEQVVRPGVGARGALRRVVKDHAGAYDEDVL